MRRARIKAVATVPVRRKATQDDSNATQNETKEPEKPVIKEEPLSTPSEEQTKVVAPKSPEKKFTSPTRVKEELSNHVTYQKEIKPTSQIKKKENEISSPSLTKVKNEEISLPTPEKEKKDEVEQTTSTEVKDNELQSKPLKTPEVIVTKNDKDLEQRFTAQSPRRAESPQKLIIPSVEGSQVKHHQSRSCFMRPTPRLDGGGRIRRNSIQGSGASASESEDDSRRSTSTIPNRVRNDSICSTQSLKETSNVNNVAKLNLGQKRRMVVSESARKLAEARREFLLKHENKAPDKAKLTMYDLIYYNPTTNPMKPKPVRQNIRKDSICSLPDKKKEEKEEEEAVDEPAELLVPQVKVGPDGQLIIDEQSLVIDQYKVQENIDRSDILVDEDTNGNGFYKRRQKSKEWSKWETLKFYKALATYGTDFLLMQSIFPKRTRLELKLKYKKEERLNRTLIEKALLYQEFDTEALDKELAKVEESERQESELNRKAKSRRGSKGSTTVKKKRKRCQKLLNEVSCDDDDQDSDSNKKNENEQSGGEELKMAILPEALKELKVKRKRVTRKRTAVKLDVNQSNDSQNEDSDSGKDSSKVKRTRSGRVIRRTKKSLPPKPIQIFDPENEELTELLPKNATDPIIVYNPEQSPEKSDRGNISDIAMSDIVDSLNDKEHAVIDTIIRSDICIEIVGHQPDQILKKEYTKISETELNFNTEIGVKKDINNLNTQNTLKTKMLEKEDTVERGIEKSIQQDIEKLNKTNQKVTNTNNIISSDIKKRTNGEVKNNEEKESQDELLETLGVDFNTTSNALDDITDDIPNMENLKPGSLVVLKKDCADQPGKTTLQVYIVSSNYDASNPNYRESLLPIDLPPDILKTVTTCIEDIEPENVAEIENC